LGNILITGFCGN